MADVRKKLYKVLGSLLVALACVPTHALAVDTYPHTEQFAANFMTYYVAQTGYEIQGLEKSATIATQADKIYKFIDGFYAYYTGEWEHIGKYSSDAQYQMSWNSSTFSINGNSHLINIGGVTVPIGRYITAGMITEDFNNALRRYAAKVNAGKQYDPKPFEKENSLYVINQNLTSNNRLGHWLLGYSNIQSSISNTFDTTMPKNVQINGFRNGSNPIGIGCAVVSKTTDNKCKLQISNALASYEKGKVIIRVGEFDEHQCFLSDDSKFYGGATGSNVHVENWDGTSPGQTVVKGNAIFLYTNAIVIFNIDAGTYTYDEIITLMKTYAGDNGPALAYIQNSLVREYRGFWNYAGVGVKIAQVVPEIEPIHDPVLNVGGNDSGVGVMTPKPQEDTPTYIENVENYYVTDESGDGSGIEYTVQWPDLSKALGTLLEGLTGLVRAFFEGLTNFFIGDLDSIELEKLKLPDLSNLFPFCIPRDLSNILGMFQGDPKAPEFDWVFLNADGSEITQHFDLADFEPVAKVVRSGEVVLFAVGLAMVTRKLLG